MIEVAVGEDDQIHFHVFDWREVGHRLIAELFGIEASIDKDVEAADLNVGGVGSDAAEAIEVDKFHGYYLRSISVCPCGDSGGTLISKGGIRTWMGSPALSMP